MSEDKQEARRVRSMRSTHRDEPDTTKHTTYVRWNPCVPAVGAAAASSSAAGLNPATDVQIVTCSCQGWRANMEDFVRFEFVNQHPVVAVCDGHGGEQVAAYTVNHLFAKVEEALQEADAGRNKLTALIEDCVEQIEDELRLHMASSSHSNEDSGQLFVPAMLESCPTTPASTGGRSRNNTHTTAASEDDLSPSEAGSKEVALEELEDQSCGTTLTMCLVEPSCILTCNVGDSRAVRATGGIQQALTEDHVPQLAREKARIESVGGTVINGRVFGGLAMTRSIGDFVYKRDAKRPVVIATPDVAVYPRNPEDEFVLVASDGLWSVLSEAEACASVRRKLRETDGNAKEVAEYLIDQCLCRDSRDNISLALIVFPAAFRHLLPVHRSYEFVLSWGEDEVRRWLASVNLSDVAAALPEDKLTGDFLVSVNDENYKQMLKGLKVGQQKKLIKKLKALREGVSGWTDGEVLRWLQFEQLDFLIPGMKSRRATGMDLCRMRYEDFETLCTSPSSKRSFTDLLSPGAWMRSRKRSDSSQYDSGSEEQHRHSGRLSREPSLRVVSEQEQESGPRPEVLHAFQRIQALVQGLDAAAVQAFLFAPPRPRSPRNPNVRGRLRSVSSDNTMESGSPVPSIALTESEDHTMSSISETSPSTGGEISFSSSPVDRFADEVIAQLSAPENLSEITSDSEREETLGPKCSAPSGQRKGSPSERRPQSPPRRGLMSLFRNVSSESNGTGTDTHVPLSETVTPRTTDPTIASTDLHQDDSREFKFDKPTGKSRRAQAANEKGATAGDGEDDEEGDGMGSVAAGCCCIM